MSPQSSTGEVHGNAIVQSTSLKERTCLANANHTYSVLHGVCELKKSSYAVNVFANKVVAFDPPSHHPGVLVPSNSAGGTKKSITLPHRDH